MQMSNRRFEQVLMRLRHFATANWLIGDGKSRQFAATEDMLRTRIAHELAFSIATTRKPKVLGAKIQVHDGLHL